MSEDKWMTAITDIGPNKILMRGYPLDEIMGRLSFAEAVSVARQDRAEFTRLLQQVIQGRSQFGLLLACPLDDQHPLAFPQLDPGLPAQLELRAQHRNRHPPAERGLELQRCLGNGCFRRQPGALNCLR